mgnify:CR=1 FL=1
MKSWEVMKAVFSRLVAPARERGLKYNYHSLSLGILCRSREGAWIEIHAFGLLDSRNQRRSREGAWIEIEPASNGEPATLSLPRGSVD